jgi:hypothetical protein
MLATYYTILSETSMVQNNKQGITISKAERNRRADLKFFEKELCRTFIRAIKSFDNKTLHEFERAIWYFQEHFKRNFMRITPEADSERGALLVLKYGLFRKRRKMTVREVARHLHTPAKVEELAEDGFSALRRKCKSMHFPLVSESKKNKSRRTSSAS